MEENKNSLQIDIEESASRGVYANLAMITHSDTEFMLDFIFIQPQAAKAQVLSRVISSPAHAKRLLWALKDNVAKYEARFGVIPAGDNPAEASPPTDVYQ
ncbi:MAG TPA: DUF3467 domain-containing protein [Elusimicrobia bacterium]|nr:DUF3467 domain-containing protein [Elusimicrobiota bacterium]HBT60925.1 DUF3467 domain-containing protein [Elusimicrobiota bacterium]